MTNDDVYVAVKKDGIKDVVKNYIENAPSDSWVIWTKAGRVFMVGDDFFVKHNLNPIFVKSCGEYFLKKFDVIKLPKKLWKKKMVEMAV